MSSSRPPSGSRSGWGSRRFVALWASSPFNRFASAASSRSPATPPVIGCARAAPVGGVNRRFGGRCFAFLSSLRSRGFMGPATCMLARSAAAVSPIWLARTRSSCSPWLLVGFSLHARRRESEFGSINTGPLTRWLVKRKNPLAREASPIGLSGSHTREATAPSGRLVSPSLSSLLPQQHCA